MKDSHKYSSRSTMAPFDKKNGKHKKDLPESKKGFVPRKKINHGRDDDDDSLDSRGNIRGLIDYSCDSEEVEEIEEDESDSYHPTESISSQDKKRKAITRSRVSRSQKKDDTRGGKITKMNRELKDLERKHESLLKAMMKEEDKEERDERLKKSKKSKNVTKPLKKSRRVVESESEEEEESEEDESEEDSEEEEDGTVETDEEEEEDSDEEEMSHPGGISISFGGFDDHAERMIPKRHNMKKESSEVKKFVKLLTTQPDEDTIDGQIDQFKALAEDQRTKLLSVLESRGKSSATASPQQGLMFKILTMNLPVETQSMVLNKYNSLQMLDPGSSEYFKMRNWLEKVTSLPLGLYKEIPVKILDGQETCGAFMEKARNALDDAIYGQDESKLQILQFIGAKIANPTGLGLSLLLAGPPGIGKTSLIKNGVAKALQWPFQFISLGGDSDASTYTGHQLVYESSHCGKIVNSLCQARSMSMVLMFDELDKISTTAKGEEVQHLLVHLTDPVQNGQFEDKYLAGIPIDLSRVMFTFSANDLGRIDRVLMDRMTVINLKGYGPKEKQAIAENYLLPVALNEVGLAEKVGISKEMIHYIIETYAGEETGVRELKRAIEQIVQKINMLRMFNTKDLPFHIKDFTLPFSVKKDHIDLFLKKKDLADQSFKAMYT